MANHSFPTLDASVLADTRDDLWFLGALVIIRTIFAYLLNREIQELGAEINNQNQ